MDSIFKYTLNNYNTITIDGFKKGHEVSNLVIPSTIELDGIVRPVTSIGFGAFDRNNLTSLVIPDSVTDIADYAFLGNKLTNAVIPDSVNRIGNSAFYSNEITNVYILADEINIRYDMFEYNPIYGMEHTNGRC